MGANVGHRVTAEQLRVRRHAKGFSLMGECGERFYFAYEDFARIFRLVSQLRTNCINCGAPNPQSQCFYCGTSTSGWHELAEAKVYREQTV